MRKQSVKSTKKSCSQQTSSEEERRIKRELMKAQLIKFMLLKKAQA